MRLVISLQLGSIALMALLALIVGGASSTTYAISALLGGLIVIIPNALFAWQLNRVTSKDSFPGAFLAGEGLKVFLTIAMLVALARSNLAFSWPMLVGAMGVALNAPLLGWFVEKFNRSDKQSELSTQTSAHH